MKKPRDFEVVQLSDTEWEATGTCHLGLHKATGHNEDYAVANWWATVPDESLYDRKHWKDYVGREVVQGSP